MEEKLKALPRHKLEELFQKSLGRCKETEEKLNQVKKDIEARRANAPAVSSS